MRLIACVAVALSAVSIGPSVLAQQDVALVADFSKADLPIATTGSCSGQHCFADGLVRVSDAGPHRMIIGRFDATRPCPIDAYCLPPDFVARYKIDASRPLVLQPVVTPCPADAKCIPPGIVDQAGPKALPSLLRRSGAGAPPVATVDPISEAVVRSLCAAGCSVMPR